MAAPPIISAARGADVETLRRLLAEGVSPDALVDQQVRRRPLHCLCLRDDEKNEGDRAACFELLRDAGANLEAGDQIGYTILHLAARDAFVELISLLVQARVNLDARSNVGTTALHRAARVSDKRAEDCVDVLLAGGASVNARDSSGETPLDVALSHHCRRVWPLLLRAGAEIPTNNTHPYIERVRNAGGWKKHEQAHLATLTRSFEPKFPMLPKELVRHVVSFWLHAGYY
mmetsp:Transcript_17694/g.52546  ORF Transcript_17694/g.52546 Transcript_17694/m.52546 type:complete len:231 (+) Transcript_17694:181-873(+)